MSEESGASRSGFADALRSASGEATDAAQAYAQAAAARISEAAREAGRQARADASKLADQASGHVKDFLRAKIRQSAGLASEAVETARAFADEIEERAPTAARTLRSTVGRFEGAAREFGEMGPDELLERTRDYARRRPTLLIGGAAVLGFVAARILKSSGSQQSTPAAPSLASGETRDDA